MVSIRFLLAIAVAVALVAFGLVRLTGGEPARDGDKASSSRPEPGEPSPEINVGDREPAAGQAVSSAPAPVRAEPRPRAGVARPLPGEPPPGPKPGPVVGAVIADGEVIQIRQWDMSEVPPPSQAHLIEHLGGIIASSKADRERMSAELVAARQRFFELGGYLDAEDMPVFEVVDDMPEEHLFELEQLETSILEMSTWLKMKDEQIGEVREELEELRGR